ncbi:hypothetical protein PHMEG_0005477 [Phytophthora megakarya]|uniref:Uncharacterized protein n=1 Tax=Phytophthora megakarya TaxID=4795 RepID=A0A225WRA6_9STRA|nr:hypothetical protein PHMEG_0005477 [Phytophthora megakarya]
MEEEHNALRQELKHARNSIPHEKVRFLDSYTHERNFSIHRTYGLGQGGIFTLPVDRFKW